MRSLKKSEIVMKTFVPTKMVFFERCVSVDAGKRSSIYHVEAVNIRGKIRQQHNIGCI